MMNEDQRRAIFAEIAGLAGIEKPRQAHEFTIHEFAEHQGCTYDASRKALHKLAKDGILQARRTVVDGRKTWVFCRPEDAA